MRSETRGGEDLVPEVVHTPVAVGKRVSVCIQSGAKGARITLRKRSCEMCDWRTSICCIQDLGNGNGNGNYPTHKSWDNNKAIFSQMRNSNIAAHHSSFLLFPLGAGSICGKFGAFPSTGVLLVLLYVTVRVTTSRTLTRRVRPVFRSRSQVLGEMAEYGELTECVPALAGDRTVEGENGD